MRTLVLLALATVACLAVVVPPARYSVAECVMCKIAVRVAAPSLGEDTVSIEKKFDEECKKELKINVEDKECEKYVNEHLDPIIHELESGTAPKDVCTKLHGC
ncbi:surfactant protein B [Oesophagostomum dentatum]|uniref:Surfactant protein B n=1 Tax=Oesophagostomum dentatum TaxID=61180 RepID=A0A0B1TMV3_OESDE|nr:surfactant protein B [Oesophagostomum dentatum]